jgi:hypothetical protein
MTRTSTSVAAVLFALAILTPSEPAVADWLVTSDGTRIETEGPWEVRQGMVVFSRADGSLASMRLSDVDVDASGSEGPPSEPGRPAADPKPANPEPILVLTNRDIPRAQTESLPPSDDRGANPGRGDRRGKRLTVTAWTVVESDAGEPVEIVGRLSNVGQRPAKRLGLVLIFLDRRGEEVGNGRAHLDDTDLRPGESTLFQLPLDHPTDFTAVKFRTHGKLL